MLCIYKHLLKYNNVDKKMYKIINSQKGFIQPCILECLNALVGTVPMRSKHYNPKFKWHRAQKYKPVDLPDYHEKFSKEQWKERMKESGIEPPRYWRTRPITITSLNDIIEPYEPPVADGKASILEKTGNVKTKVQSYRTHSKALKLIRSYEGNFNIKVFPQEAHDLYVKAHTVLMNKNPEELSEYVTERAIMEMMEGLKLKTLRWKLIESLEPPTVVQVRTAPIIMETNHFAQITVRFHTKQSLAIYDRFGRLLYGSEIVPKDVLEYVVFEKHIVNEYGKWRMHAKIIPDWMPPKEPALKTYRVEKIDDSVDEEDVFVEEDRESSEVFSEEKTSDETLEKAQ